MEKQKLVITKAQGRIRTTEGLLHVQVRIQGKANYTRLDIPVSAVPQAALIALASQPKESSMHGSDTVYHVLDVSPAGDTISLGGVTLFTVGDGTEDQDEYQAPTPADELSLLELDGDDDEAVMTTVVTAATTTRTPSSAG